jgi:hypothetical protein
VPTSPSSLTCFQVDRSAGTPAPRFSPFLSPNSRPKGCRTPSAPILFWAVDPRPPCGFRFGRWSMFRGRSRPSEVRPMPALHGGNKSLKTKLRKEASRACLFSPRLTRQTRGRTQNLEGRDYNLHALRRPDAPSGENGTSGCSWRVASPGSPCLSYTPIAPLRTNPSPSTLLSSRHAPDLPALSAAVLLRGRRGGSFQRRRSRLGVPLLLGLLVAFAALLPPLPIPHPHHPPIPQPAPISFAAHLMKTKQTW